MPRPRLRPAVRDYLLERLKKECEPHGRARQVAAALGYTPSHLSNVLRGERTLGDQMADDLMTYWGLEPERIDRRLPAESDAPPLNLRATLEFARGEYPEAFVDRFAEQMRNTADRPRRIWLAQIDVAYWEWRQAQKAAQKHRNEQPFPKHAAESGVMERGALHGESIRPQKRKRTRSA